MKGINCSPAASLDHAQPWQHKPRTCGRHQETNRFTHASEHDSIQIKDSTVGKELAGGGDLAGTDFGKILQDRQDLLLLELRLGGELVGKLGLGHGFGVGLHGLGLHRGLHCRSHVLTVGRASAKGLVKA